MSTEKLEVTFDTETKELNFSMPSDLTLALGMAQYASEAVLFKVRASLMPRVLPAPPGVLH